ncbi:MAG: ATP-binding protein [Treponema sp.]|nr:ATP-binding protein [Treponema sp.]
MFIGRKAELAVMEERYRSGKFELCIMYGRRRVGKTTLINEFIKGKENIFFTAMETSARGNLTSLSRSIMMGNNRGLQNSVFPGFMEALESIFAFGRKKRLVFVIDEFPFLAASYPPLSSILQRLIDEEKSNSRLFMIINGSSLSLMENYFFTYKRPLYGRKTFQLKIEPFGFFEMKDYFTRTDAETLPYIYGAYGGVPKYFEEYDEKISFKNNLLKDYLQKGAPLLDEPANILKQEVRDPSNYNAIITAIASGNTQYSEISDKAKLESGNITGFINNLMSLNLIKKEAPVLEGGSKRSLYEVADNMIRFWFRFIPGNLSLIHSGKAELALVNIEAELDTYMGKVFEDICREYLWTLNGTQALPFAFADVGRWWGSDRIKKQEVEIDLIALDGKGSAIFCECKWRKRKTGPEILDDLVEKSGLPAFEKINNKWLFIFSRSGFTGSCRRKASLMRNVRLIDYREMFL